MAAKTAKMLNDFDISSKKDRLAMNRLRDLGLEYVSSSGKIIPAKTQPEHFCHCPQKCKTKLSKHKWDELFERFYNLGDQNKQNQFLQSHIVIKAVHLHNWESEKPSPTNKKRVTCKYHVPNLSDDSDLEVYVTRKGNDSIEVCQKAFMNCYGITEKRVRMQRERCISKLAPDHYKHSPFGKKHKIKDKSEMEQSECNTADLGNEIEITPLDLRNEKKKRTKIEDLEKVQSNTENQNGKDQPLDLSCPNNVSHSSNSNPTEIEFDKTSLYEVALKLGFPKETIDKEMAQKYEEYLRKNLRKAQQGLSRKRKRHSMEDLLTNYKTEIENRSPIMSAVTDQVVGLDDELTILPIQTLNNGDLTITPVLGSVSKPVENRDIMRGKNNDEQGFPNRSIRKTKSGAPESLLINCVFYRRMPKQQTR